MLPLATRYSMPYMPHYHSLPYPSIKDLVAKQQPTRGHTTTLFMYDPYDNSLHIITRMVYTKL